MQRIMVIGTSGCGKTTLAKNLAGLLDIKSYDLDDYHWLPNWQMREELEFKTMVTEITDTESWVISGNAYNIREITLYKSDTIIWLDYSFMTCFFRALTRTIRRLIYRKEQCCGDNYESFQRQFLSKDSILIWVVTSFKRRKRQYTELFSNQHPNIKYLRFTHPEHAAQWFAELDPLKTRHLRA